MLYRQVYIPTPYPLNMEATIRITYEMNLTRDEMTADELREYIERYIYVSNDIGEGFDEMAEEVGIEIEIDEE